MIKIVATIRRRAGMTKAEFLDYIVNVHGKIARDNPVTLRRYRQTHIEDGAYGTTGDATHLTQFGRDSVTELWFDDMAALGRCFSDPYTRDVVQPDGVNFSDLPSAVSVLTAEKHTQGTQGGPGLVKALWFIKADRSIAQPDFEAHFVKADEAAQGVAGIVGRALAIALPSPPEAGAGGDDYFGGQETIHYDGVKSLWIEGDMPSALAAMRAQQARFENAAPWLDRSRSFWLIGREHVVFDLSSS